MLIQAGHPNAKALKGGVAAWQEAGLPMVQQG
jgi:rhodanese-related sulfurtransferase